MIFKICRTGLYFNKAYQLNSEAYKGALKDFVTSTKTHILSIHSPTNLRTKTADLIEYKLIVFTDEPIA